MPFMESTAIRRYSKHIAQTQSRLATWKPGDKLALGDVGVIHRGSFRKETDLAQLGIDFEAETGTKQPSLSCSSIAGGSLEAGASADYLEAKAAVGFEMSRVGEAIFEAQGVQHHLIGNQSTVTQRILQLFDAKKWRRKWVLVDQVWTADRATIVVSVSSDALLSLEADGHPVEGLTALGAAGQLSLSVFRGKVVSTVGLRDLTPMYTARKINLLGNDVVPTRDGEESTRGLAPVSLDDVIKSLDDPEERPPT